MTATNKLMALAGENAHTPPDPCDLLGKDSKFCKLAIQMQDRWLPKHSLETASLRSIGRPPSVSSAVSLSQSAASLCNHRSYRFLYVPL